MRLSFFYLLFLVPAFLTAQLDLSQLDRECQAALDSFDTPGFAIGIIKDGKIILAKGYGLREKGKAGAVDANTIFAIASNTKAFTATALAQLAAEKQISLDDPVRNYLPDFQLYDSYVSEHIILRDLLCHRAGLGTFSGDAIWFKNQKTAAQIVQQIRYVPQAYEFRAGYGYSNLMFITAGEVLGAATGKPWYTYLQEHYFKPLGMTRTFHATTQLAKVDNVAMPHITRLDNTPIPYVQWDNMGAAGGLLSSVNDMLAWLGVQLANGEYQGKTVLPAAVLSETWKPHTPIGGSNNFLSYGLGYFLSEMEGQRIVTHGGGYDGMYSRVTMAPDLNLGIVVLTNSMTSLSSRLATRVLRSYLQLPAQDWLTEGAAGEKRAITSWEERKATRLAARQPNTTPTLPTGQLVGTYFDPLYGNISISQQGDALQLDFADAPGLAATLTHWHYDTYLINWKETNAWFDFGTIRFVADNNQHVTSIRFDVPNDDIFFNEIEAERVQK